MITLHHLHNSRSHRIIWMLEEIGVQYTIEHYQRDIVTNLAPNSLKRIHPLGKAPVLTDDDNVIAESGAIIEYLAERFPDSHLAPRPATQARIDYTYWLHFCEGTMMPPLVAKLVLDKVRTNAKPLPIKVVANKIVDKIMDAYYGPNIQNNLQFVEMYLNDREFFAGDSLSGADIQMSFPLEATLSRIDDHFPNIKRFVDEMQSRPAYRRALEKTGQYDYA